MDSEQELSAALRDAIGRSARHGRGGICRIVQAGLVYCENGIPTVRLVGQSSDGQTHGWTFTASSDAADPLADLARCVRNFGRPSIRQLQLI